MIRIVLGGDLMLGRTFNKYHLGPEIWTDLIEVFDNYDATIINLETTITSSSEKWPNKTFNYKMTPKNADILLSANIRYCSLANNHILDFKLDGMLDTMYYLDKLGIIHSGTGMNLQEAMRPAFLEINGIKIGFLSAADHYAGWAATPSDYGIWYIPLREENRNDWKYIFDQVRRVKKQSDFLIFSLHWNNNYVDYIDPIYIDFAHALIDNGVNIIHGHSPHHLLPIERYNGGIICYSLGDLLDDYAINDQYRNDLACLVGLTLNKKDDQVKIDKIYPTKISDLTVSLVTSDVEYNIIEDMIFPNSN